MCSDWMEEGNGTELTLDQIADIFRNPLFDSTEKFALSGGEPVLRDDLSEIAEIVLKSCPRIKELLLLTNGLEPTLVMERVKALVGITNRSRLTKFAVSVSIDGCGEVQERIRRVPQAFDRVSETLRALKELQKETPFYLSAVCVVQPSNAGNLVELADFGNEMGLPITFVPVQTSQYYVKSTDAQSALGLTGAQLDELKSVFTRQLEPLLMPTNLPFWREYFNIAAGERRRLPCFLSQHYVRLDSDGKLGSCFADSSFIYGSALDTPAERLWFSDDGKRMRRKIESSHCPACTIHCDLAFCFSHEFFYYSRFLLKEKGRRLLRKLLNGARNG